MPATRRAIATAVRELLAQRGPLSEEDLLDGLTRNGIELGQKPQEVLAEILDDEELSLVLPLTDGRYADLPSLLTGRTFTHRLTSAEIKHGYLAVSPDLTPLSLLTDDPAYQHLMDGSAVQEVLTDLDDSLLIARGIPLDGFPDTALLLGPKVLRRLRSKPGDLVGLTVRPGGLELATARVWAPPDEIAARVLGSLRAEEPEQIDSLIWQLCAADEALFSSQALPPLAETFAAAQLVCDGDQVAAPGFDFQRWRVERRIALIRSMHGLTEDEALAVLVLSRMFADVADLVDAAATAIDEGESLEDLLPDLDSLQALLPAADEPCSDQLLVRSMLDFLADPGVAQALLVEALGTDRADAMALGVFAESLEPEAPRRAKAALRWLRGKALERLGSLLEAEQEFEATLALDPTWQPALFDLARVASDRGQAERGLSLLRQAGASPDDHLVALLTHFRAAERSDIGRNQPCWCGSGRKYKVCHRGREQAPLEERAAWLYQKAGQYLSDGPWREQVIELASIRAAHWQGPGALREAMNEPLVADALLFEGGAFEDFLHERGVLLPDDERLLGDQWLLAERSVFEIEQVTRGSGFVARDLRTGDRVEVRERAGSHQLSEGMLICARLVPAGPTVQCFGGLEVVTMAERDLLLDLLDDEPEPEELVALLSRRFAPPQLQNTEGEPLVLCQATLRSPDPEALARALSSAYERDSTEPRWHEHVTTHGMQRIRAVITLVGDEVGVETNSEARQERVLTALHGLQAGLQVVSQSRNEAADLMEATSRAPARTPATTQLDPDEPAIATALEEFIRTYEESWLDQSIPALAGSSPREAAADPTRRPDLLRLLDSFPQPGPGQMDAARLRAALGL